MDLLAAPLAAARRAQGELYGMVQMIGSIPQLETAGAAMSSEVVSNSAIEGVDLQLEAVRASMLLRLGAKTAGLPPEKTRRVDPIVGVLTEAVQGWRQPLTLERIFGWHRAIFPGGFSPQLGPIQVGALRGEEPMVVATVAKALDAPDQIHFEAPGRGRLEKEMNDFLAWFQDPPKDLDGLIRAGLAHLWFITIHPLEDGNGRIARTITDLALAQDEQSGLRFYALSAQIVRRKDAYYDALEQAQRGGLDVTAFVAWFLGEVREAARQGVEEVYRVLARSRFWARADQYHLNARQIKALRHALSPFNAESVLSNRKYRTITEAIRTTATRDLTQLVELGLLVLSGEKRGATYRVPLETFLPE
jgi:Fic family protein